MNKVTYLNSHLDKFRPKKGPPKITIKYEEIDGIWHTAPAPRFSRTPGRIRPIAKDGAEVVARWQEKS